MTELSCLNILIDSIGVGNWDFIRYPIWLFGWFCSNPTSGTLPGNPHQINQHYSLASASNTLPPGASGMTSSHRRSPVSNAPLASTSGQNPNIAQNPNISQNTGTSSLNSSGVSQSGHQGSGSVVGSGNISSQTAAPGVQTVVAYYFCNETIPYRTTVPHKDVTLGQFKALLTRRGRFRLVLVCEKQFDFHEKFFVFCQSLVEDEMASKKLVI